MTCAEWKDYPTCPHCGAEDQDWTEGQPSHWDGDTWEVECSECHKRYKITLYVQALFKSEPVS